MHIDKNHFKDNDAVLAKMRGRLVNIFKKKKKGKID